MATFIIRRNHPHAGVVSLCKLPGGGFVATEMRVSEAAFIGAVMRYLKDMPAAEKSKLRRSAPPPIVAPPGNGEHRPFKVRKAAAAAAS